MNMNDISLISGQSPQGDIIFFTCGNKEILRLHSDGRITVSEDAKPDEVAIEFLNSLSRMFPTWIRQPSEFP